MKMEQTTLRRFETKVDKSGPISKQRPDFDPCHVWTAYLLPGGYGQFWNGTTMVLAHRWAWENLVGPIPEYMQVDHMCKVRRCVNPKHLRLLTTQENTACGDAGLHLANKTHCPKGHPYSGENLYLDLRGKRGCKACRKDATERYGDKKKLAKAT